MPGQSTGGHPDRLMLACRVGRRRVLLETSPAVGTACMSRLARRVAASITRVGARLSSRLWSFTRG